MKLNDIAPYVRFATKQTIFHSENVVNYDRRFYYCLNNSGIITINGTSYNLKKDTFIMWNAGSVYSYTTSMDEGIEIISANFDLSRSFNYKNLPIPSVSVKSYNPSKLLNENFHFEDAVSLNDTIYIENASKLKELVVNLQLEYRKNLKYKELQCNTIMQKIILECVGIVENYFPSVTENLVSEVLNYIQRNYKNNPTNKEIGLKFNYHPNYLNSLIVKHTGVSIHNYLLTYKLNKAIDLLVTTNMTVNEISQYVGIDDPQYFSRLFTKFFHKTPSHFRYK